MAMNKSGPTSHSRFNGLLHCSRTIFREQIAVLCELIHKRLLPTFVSIESEADAISDDAWERWNATAGPDSDPAIAAEAAEHAGVNHYIAMINAKQGLLNLFAVALYHLIEQQQLTVLRQELVSSNEVIILQDLKIAEFVRRLADVDIALATFTSWPAIEELRNVANVVKHAEGYSAELLRSQRPEIFTAPSLRGEEQPLLQGASRWLFQPLSGQDLYVTTDDLERYFGAAHKFWLEFEEAAVSRHRP